MAVSVWKANSIAPQIAALSNNNARMTKMFMIKNSRLRLVPARIPWHGTLKYYCWHVSGELREEQVREQLMTSFRDTRERGQVSYAEFEEYYEGLSVAVTSDDDFINILKNAWSV